MPTIELSDEELRGLVNVLATASGPGINWMLTNNLLQKLQAAEQADKTDRTDKTPRRHSNSEDRNATLPGT